MSEDPYHTEFVSWRVEHFSFFLRGKFHYFFNPSLTAGDPSTGVWIAGSDNGHHGTWAWFSTGQLIQRGDWGVGQPRGGDHHCLYLVGGGGGGVGYQWADFHCDFQVG